VVIMAEIVDLEPAARRLSHLLERIGDDQLAAATPCDGSTVADLLDHVDGLAQAFAAAATKDAGPMTATPPAPDGARLSADWRAEIPDHLSALARAWTDPAAWDGMTQVGGVTLPGEVAGRIALNEIVLHGWDLAQATGQPYPQDPGSLEACHSSLRVMYPPDDLDRRRGIFGPPVDVPDDAPLLDRVVAFSGRDPGWTG
jgi:uncharacterized protein (TIGR03086 family)